LKKFFGGKMQKLPKGWRITVKKEDGIYWGNYWENGMFRGTSPVGSEYRDNAREYAIYYFQMSMSEKNERLPNK
jgi:hypothetical protein